MASIIIAGDAVVVKSALKLEEIRTIEKYRPEALILKGGEDGKEPIFALGTTNGAGSINKIGASFGRASHDEDELAIITLCDIVKGCGEAVEQVADYVGNAIINLNKLEAKLPAVLEEIAAEKAAVKTNITVAQ